MSQELFDALSDLRNDPLIRGAVEEARREGRAGGGDSGFGGPHIATSSTHQPASASVGTVAALSSSSPNPNAFYKDREETRDEVGTVHWLKQHRDDLSVSEKRRVENRLRAENMFAVAQLEYEQFVSDMQHPSSSSPSYEKKQQQQQQQQKATTTGDNTVTPHRRGSPQQAAASTTSGKRQPPSGHTPMVGDDTPRTFAPPDASPIVDPSFFSPQSVPALGADHTPRGGSTGGRQGYALDHSSITAGGGQQQQLPASAAASLAAHRVTADGDTTAKGEVEEEEDVYHRKLKQLYGEEATTTPPAAGGGGGGVGDGSPSGAPGARHTTISSSSAAASLPYRQSPLQRRFDQDYASLVEAVQQRDRTIERLERLLREDKDYYEGQLLQKRTELENVNSICENRIKAMKTEMNRVLNSTKYAADVDQHDIRGKLANIEHSYERGVTDIRTEFGVLLQNYQSDNDLRMREVVESSERAVRKARDSYTVDHNTALDAQRKGMVESLRQSQDLMLQEAEMKLRSDLEKVLLSRVKASIESSVRAQLRQELLPIVKQELLGSVKAQLISSAKTELQQQFKEQSKKWTAEQLQRLSTPRGGGGQASPAPSEVTIATSRAPPPPAAAAPGGEVHNNRKAQAGDMLQKVASLQTAAEEQAAANESKKQQREAELAEKRSKLAAAKNVRRSGPSMVPRVAGGAPPGPPTVRNA